MVAFLLLHSLYSNIFFGIFDAETRSTHDQMMQKNLKSFFLASTGVPYTTYVALLLVRHKQKNTSKQTKTSTQTNTQLSNFGSYPWRLYYSTKAAVAWIISTKSFIAAMLNHSSLGKQEMSTQNAGDMSLSEPEHGGHLGPHDLQHPQGHPWPSNRCSEV